MPEITENTSVLKKENEGSGQKQKSLVRSLTWLVAAGVVILLTQYLASEPDVVRWKAYFKRSIFDIYDTIDDGFKTRAKEKYMKEFERRRQFCDHDNWKIGWSIQVWRQDIRHCVEYDLSLRSKPLGDEGVARLTEALSGKQFLHSDHAGMRKINLEGNEITSIGAARLARWISTDSVDPLSLEEAYRIRPAYMNVPTAIVGTLAQPFEVHLQSNPISSKGRLQLERAVDRALENGIHVIVYGGGSCDASKINTLKLGFLELTLGGQRLDKEGHALWRYPPTLQHDVSSLSKFLGTFTLGIALGVAVANISPSILKKGSKKILLPVLKTIEGWVLDAPADRIESA